jgi:hypothetical protein
MGDPRDEHASLIGTVPQTMRLAERLKRQFLAVVRRKFVVGPLGFRC